MYCTVCGTQLQPDSSFCQQCGAGTAPSSARAQEELEPHARYRRRYQLWRVGVLGLFTLGLYFFYWAYVTWKQMGQETDKEHHPFWHTMALFVPIWSLYIIHSHFSAIRELQKRATVASNVVPGLAVALFLVAGLATVADLLIYGDDLSPLTFLAPLVLTGTIVWGQGNLNRYWDVRDEDDRRPAKWGPGEIAVGALGAVIAAGFILIMLPPSSAVTSVFEAGAIGPIVIDSEQTGSIEGFLEVDAYSFEAMEGRQYVIQTRMALPGDPLENAPLVLWDTDGSTVLEKERGGAGPTLSSIAWTPSLSGTYYLTVEAEDGFAKGRYHLNVRQDAR